jgi:hypothetical protein
MIVRVIGQRWELWHGRLSVGRGIMLEHQILICHCPVVVEGRDPGCWWGGA